MRNFLNARYGGSSIEQRVNAIVEKFISFDDNEVLVLNDDDGVMSGIVLISAVQKEIYRRWGDSLVLDWTHNTNNMGFLLGQFVGTTTMSVTCVWVD